MEITDLTGNRKAADWIAIPRPNQQARLRLFCVPYAGAGTHAFRQWPEILPSDVEVCVVRLPGRESRLRDTPFCRITPLVEALTQALVAYFDKPFALFGHSMGAKIIFELANRIRSGFALEPVMLFVSGCNGPQVTRTQPPTYNLPDPEFLQTLYDLNGTPREVIENPELMQLLMPALRADFELVQTYAYSPGLPLNCPIIAFGGLEDRDVSRTSLEAWRYHTASLFSLQMFKGNHFFLHTSQAAFLESLSFHLQRVLRTTVQTKNPNGNLERWNLPGARSGQAL